MKLLVDMNLSPSWVDRLARHGFEAVPWSAIGAATASDNEILAYAHRHNLVLITNDFDFSAILAAGAADGPSTPNHRKSPPLNGERRFAALAQQVPRPAQLARPFVPQQHRNNLAYAYPMREVCLLCKARRAIMRRCVSVIARGVLMFEWITGALGIAVFAAAASLGVSAGQSNELFS